MTRLTGAALDRAVANAMGLKSVNNCEQWGEEHMTNRIEIEYELKAEEDDDIQVYIKPWVGLTDREMMDAISLDDTPMEMGRKIEQALKERNT